MAYEQLGNTRTKTCLVLVVILAFTTQSCHSTWQLLNPLTLTLNSGYKFISILSQKEFESLVDCLCSYGKSTCSFTTNSLNGLNGLLPTTISDDLDDLSTWRITISDDLEHSNLQYTLTRHNSKNSDLKCWKKEDRETMNEDPTCSSKPQRVYLGGSRWLVIDDTVEVVTYKYEDNYQDCNVECMGDCGTTPTTRTTPTPSHVDITNIIMGIETDTTGTTEAQTESSSDQTPVIVGVVIAVLVVLILLAILAVILWRRKRSQQAEANPTFAAFNPGAHVENARNEDTEYGDSQSVSTLPPPYSEVERARKETTEGGDAKSVPTLPPPYSEVERTPQHGFTNDGFVVSGDV